MDTQSKRDWRNYLAILISGACYLAPCIVMQMKWPIFVLGAEQRFPPVSLTLGFGLIGPIVGWILLVGLLPPLLAARGRLNFALRWRRGALQASWIGLALVPLHVAMRLPLPFWLRMVVMVALIVAGSIAMLRFERSIR